MFRLQIYKAETDDILSAVCLFTMTSQNGQNKDEIDSQFTHILECQNHHFCVQSFLAIAPVLQYCIFQAATTCLQKCSKGNTWDVDRKVV